MKNLMITAALFCSCLSAHAGIVDDGNQTIYHYNGVERANDYHGPIVMDFGGGAVTTQEPVDTAQILSLVKFDGRRITEISLMLMQLAGSDTLGNPIYRSKLINVDLPALTEESKLDQISLRNPNEELALLEVTRAANGGLDVRAVSSAGDFDLVINVMKR